MSTAGACTEVTLLRGVKRSRNWSHKWFSEQAVRPSGAKARVFIGLERHG